MNFQEDKESISYFQTDFHKKASLCPLISFVAQQGKNMRPKIVSLNLSL